jgi:hypothetical protein
MEILIVLLVLCALVLMVHCWRASLVVLGVIVALAAYGSSLPSTSAPVVSASVKDTFCNAPFNYRRAMWLAAAGDAKRREYEALDPVGRRMMWTTIGARVGCAF